MNIRLVMIRKTEARPGGAEPMVSAGIRGYQLHLRVSALSKTYLLHGSQKESNREVEYMCFPEQKCAVVWIPYD